MGDSANGIEHRETEKVTPIGELKVEVALELSVGEP